jgi:hypothetical protein
MEQLSNLHTHGVGVSVAKNGNVMGNTPFFYAVTVLA